MSGTELATITTTGNTALKLDLSGEGGSAGTDITSIKVLADGNGGYTFKALNGTTDVTKNVTASGGLASLFSTSEGSGTTPGSLSLSSAGAAALGGDATGAGTQITSAVSKSYVAPTYPAGSSFAKSGTPLTTITLATAIDPADLTSTTGGSIKKIAITANGSGGYNFAALDASDNAVTVTDATNTLADLFKIGSASGTPGSDPLTAASISLTGAAVGTVGSDANATAISSALSDVQSKSATQATKLGTVSVNLNSSGNAANVGDPVAYTSVNVYADGNGGYAFRAVDSSGNENATASINANAANLFSVDTATSGDNAKTISGAGVLAANPNVAAASDGLKAVTSNNVPPKVSDIDISTTAGANQAIEAVDNALNAVNTIQASLGAAQNRFTSIASTQTQQATNLSSAQSQITDANFAQETANLSKAQVLQQAGISVLAQANSMPQQVLKLLG
ncbi:flagellin [Caballeronia sp. INDeC2]|uniref:flagellin n=1 Tax=Caballeronia sp. INDeC2 TaxID=2921747 RepID=UPI0032ECFEA3